MRFKIHPLVGAIVFLLVLFLVLVGTIFRPQILPALREQIPLLQIVVVSNNDYAFYDPFGKPYPITVQRGFGTKLAVSGWVQEESLLEDGSITVAVPSDSNPGGYWVKAYLSEGTSHIGVLKLENGKFEPTQFWEPIFLEGIPEFIKPGRQVVLHLSTSEDETDEIINEFQNSKGQKKVELHSLNQIVIGVFE